MPYPSKTDRNSILLAAVEEISHSGIRDLSLRNLASLLGLAPTALYRYFSDRAELEAALANECARQLENVLRKAVLGADATEALRRICSSYVSFAREHRNLYEVMMSPHSPKYNYSAKQSLWIFTTERVALLSGTTKAPEAAVALWALLHGTVALGRRRCWEKINRRVVWALSLKRGSLRCPPHLRETKLRRTQFRRKRGIGTREQHLLSSGDLA